jgi:ribose transport system substrate-binding protein
MDNKKQDSVLTDVRISRGDLLKRTGAGAAALGVGGLLAPMSANAKFAVISAKKYKIAIVPKALDNPVFALGKLGLEQRAKELGDVEPIFTAATQTVTAQDVSIVEGLVTSKVDAIGISCNDPVAYNATIDKGIAAGIKIMCWDSDAPASKRIAFYGVNSEGVGAEMGAYMTKLLNNKGNVVIVSGDAAALNLNLRIKGVKSKLGSGIKLLNTYFTKDDTPTAAADTEAAIQAYSNLDGIIMVGGWALFSSEGATPLLDKAKGKIKCISFDPLQPVTQYMKDGIVQAVWSQDYWGWGYQTCGILYSMLQGQKWHENIPQPSQQVNASEWKSWASRWADSASGNLAKSAKAWYEPAFKAPGPMGSTGPLVG